MLQALGASAAVSPPHNVAVSVRLDRAPRPAGPGHGALGVGHVLVDEGEDASAEGRHTMDRLLKDRESITVKLVQ